MWFTRSFKTNAEYASRDASGAICRTSMPCASCPRSVRKSVCANRIPDADSLSARSASSGLAVSTQQSVTPESSSIGGGRDTEGLGFLHGGRCWCDSGRGQLTPQQNAEADEQRRHMQRRTVDRREVGKRGGHV